MGMTDDERRQYKDRLKKVDDDVYDLQEEFTRAVEDIARKGEDLEQQREDLHDEFIRSGGTSQEWFDLEDEIFSDMISGKGHGDPGVDGDSDDDDEDLSDIYLRAPETGTPSPKL